MPSLQDALSKVQISAPVPKIRPQKKAAASKKAKAAPKLPRRVPCGTWDTGRIDQIYGTKERHSESRPPPEHEYFPERHFGGPIYSSTPRYFPFTIHKTSKP